LRPGDEAEAVLAQCRPRLQDQKDADQDEDRQGDRCGTLRGEPKDAVARRALHDIANALLDRFVERDRRMRGVRCERRRVDASTL
jgi:hypothetical protein